MAQDDKSPDLPAIRARLKSEWAERDDLINEMRALRFMEVEPDVPAAYDSEIVRSPTGYQIVERMTGTLTADDPLITVPPAKEGDQAVERASNLERSTSALLAELARQQDADPLERFIECLLADGHGAMRILYAPQVWKGYPKRDKKGGESDTDYTRRTEEWKRGRPIPIHWAWLDPLNVYPMWSEAGLEAVLETDTRDIATLNPGTWNIMDNPPELWELTRSSSGAGSAQGGQVEFTQLWTRDTLTYAVNDVVVHHQKHRYGRPPYVYAYGISPSTTERKYRGLSILFPLRHILPQLDRMLSQKATAVRLWCWPTPIIRVGSNQALLAQMSNGQAQIESGIPRTIEIVPGQTVTLYEDEEISFLTWQGNGPDADEMVALMMQMVEKAGLADVMYGQGGGESGYMVNQLIAAARMKFKPIVAHAERGMEQLIQALWDIVEYQIKQPLYLYDTQTDSRGKAKGQWLALKPEDLDGYRQVRVKVNPMLPTDTYAKSSQAINEVRAGLRSIPSAMEMIGIEQPDEMEREILWDEFKRDPVIKNLLVAEVAKRYGIKMAQEQAPDMQMGADALAQVMGGLPPALQQAILAGMMAQQQPGAGQVPPQGTAVPPGIGQVGPQVMGAPGVQAIPPQPTPTTRQLMPQGTAVPAPTAGRHVRPAGVATGRAPGAKRQGQER
jgi:hypothetical protein